MSIKFLGLIILGCGLIAADQNAQSFWSLQRQGARKAQEWRSCVKLNGYDKCYHMTEWI